MPLQTLRRNYQPPAEPQPEPEDAEVEDATPEPVMGLTLPWEKPVPDEGNGGVGGNAA